MKPDAHLFKYMLSYLQRAESASERKALYKFYASMRSTELVTVSERLQIGKRAKQRLRADLHKQRAYFLNPSLYRWVSVAAALVMIVGFMYWKSHVQHHAATMTDLAQFIPGKEMIQLILPTGEKVNLNAIQDGDTLSVGRLLVSRNNNGAFNYTEREDGLFMGLNYTLETPKSLTAEMLLSDGTKVLLNGGSKLHFPAQFTTGNRVVTLEGEAYFDVKKSTTQSRFLVLTKGQQTEVLGTKFNVKAYAEGESETTLLAGCVKVELSHNKVETLLVIPGQKVVQQSGKLSLQSVDLKAVLGWTEAVFYFNGQNTADVFSEIERWYGIQITYHEDKSRIHYIGKVPRNLALTNLIKLLVYADFNVDVSIDKRDKLKLIIN